MPRQTPAVGDWYESRDRRYVMRISRVDGDRVRCWRIGLRGMRASSRSFVLPLSFFSSPACGWRRLVDEPAIARSTGNL